MTELIRRSADGKNLEILSPSIGTQLVERGRIDEVDHLHVLPRLLGDGTRLHDVADGHAQAAEPGRR